MIPGAVRLVSLALWLLPLAAQAEKRFEITGKLLQEDGKPFRSVTPAAFLQNAGRPFLKRTLVGRGGDFKFKKLQAGTYTLVIDVPGRGQIRRTVEVGASFADEKGRVRTIVQFEPARRPQDQLTVSVAQLSIPAKAQREYQKSLGRLEKGDVDAAIRHLEKAVEIAPRFSTAWNQLGTIAYRLGDYPLAETRFREAHKQDPSAYPPVVNLAGALLSQKKVREALALNLLAVTARPEEALPHSQLGQNYFYLGRLEEAVDHLEKAKELDPAHFSLPRLFLAEIYRRQGNREAEVAELQEFLRYHPDTEIAEKIRRLLNE